MLSYCVDLLRTSPAFADKPCFMLERHQLSRHPLGTQPDCLPRISPFAMIRALIFDSADGEQNLRVEEICSYDSHTTFWQIDPTTDGVECVALLQIVLQPIVSLSSSRFASSSKHLKIKLPGACTIKLEHEVYKITLPKLRVKHTSDAAVVVELAGKILTRR